MHTTNGARVTITEEGRSGSVTCDFEGRTIAGWWEFAGGDAIAIVHLPASGWPAAQRASLFRTVASEVIRQKCPGCRADIDETSGWITIRK